VAAGFASTRARDEQPLQRSGGGLRRTARVDDACSSPAAASRDTDGQNSGIAITNRFDRGRQALRKRCGAWTSPVRVVMLDVGQLLPLAARHLCRSQRFLAISSEPIILMPFPGFIYPLSHRLFLLRVGPDCLRATPPDPSQTSPRQSLSPRLPIQASP
jgi:hypothetical protein